MNVVEDGTDIPILSLFLPAWKQVLAEADEAAHNHYIFTQRVEKDVEIPLRNYMSEATEAKEFNSQKTNMASLATTAATAQRDSDKLTAKGGKANASKLESANSKLQNAHQQWDAQAPFIMETFQMLDEARLNHLRELLTQYQTHELQALTDRRRSIEKAMNALLEVDTAQEIKNWAQAMTVGKPITERRARQLSMNPSIGSVASPDSPAPTSSHGDDMSSHSNSQDHGRGKWISSPLYLAPLPNTSVEPRIKRIGTMLGRRRQSIHGGFARATSPTKMPVPFNRSGSRDGSRPSPSPRPSITNLNDPPRLSSLAESPPSQSPSGQLNGFVGSLFNRDPRSPGRSSVAGSTRAGSADLSEAPSPHTAPPASLIRSPDSSRDSEGFSSPAPLNDPISLAQQEAAQELDQPQFKVDIRNEPIPEQDADAQAALSNVTNTLRTSVAVPPTRKQGTIRGRRDVRNTMYNPTALEMPIAEQAPLPPPSPNLPPVESKAKVLSPLTSPDLAASDTTSIRSGTSMANNFAVKHADSPLPGINVSIIETVSATFENGQVTTAKIGGEIALNHNDDDLSPVSPMSGRSRCLHANCH